MINKNFFIAKRTPKPTPKKMPEKTDAQINFEKMIDYFD